MGDRPVEQKDGFFLVQVGQIGQYVFSIFDVSASVPLLIAEKKFEAVDLPDPSATIGSKSCGFISKRELKSSDSLLVKSKKQSASLILSFKLVLVNGKIGRAEFESKNKKLTPEMKSAILSAPEGTTIIFEYIRALIRIKGAGISVNLPSISFILQN